MQDSGPFPDRVETIFDAAAENAVFVARPGKRDVVIISADRYADLIDASQDITPLDSDGLAQDDMLSTLANGRSRP